MPRRATPSRDVLVRAVKLARHPHVKATEVRARFGLSERVLRDAKKMLAIEARWTHDDLVLAALHEQANGLDARAIAAFVDWVDHSPWSEAETTARLESLEGEGWVVRDDARWRLVREWP